MSTFFRRTGRRSVLLAVLLALSVSACGAKPDHNETEGSNLGHWGRALSAVLTGRYGDLSTDWFGGVEKNGAERCAEILRDEFGIEDRDALLRELRFSLRSGAREDYHYEADALLLLKELPEEEYAAAMEALSPQGRRRFELVAYNVDQWGELGLLGWDLSKVALLAQLGYSAGSLTHEEAQAVIEPAAQVAKSYFTTWEQFCQNVLDGEALQLSISPADHGGDYAARSAWLKELVERQEEKDPLFDDGLFEQEIDPLEEVSHTSLLG